MRCCLVGPGVVWSAWEVLEVGDRVLLVWWARLAGRCRATRFPPRSGPGETDRVRSRRPGRNGSEGGQLPARRVARAAGAPAVKVAALVPRSTQRAGAEMNISDAAEDAAASKQAGLSAQRHAHGTCAPARDWRRWPQRRAGGQRQAASTHPPSIQSSPAQPSPASTPPRGAHAEHAPRHPRYRHRHRHRLSPPSCARAAAPWHRAHPCPRRTHSPHPLRLRRPRIGTPTGTCTRIHPRSTSTSIGICTSISRSTRISTSISRSISISTSISIRTSTSTSPARMAGLPH